MTKHFTIIAALTLVASVSCSKNELQSVEAPQQEISYQTVVGSHQTKATALSYTYKFYSWAWNHSKELTEPENTLNGIDLTEETGTWSEANAGKVTNYFSENVVSYSPIDKVWRASEKCYWPKNTYLTFYAWTNGTPTPMIYPAAPAPMVGCSNTTGIVINPYDVVLNKNKDFMVAEVKYNQSGNGTGDSYHPESAGGNWWNKGVPTIFHHQLCKFQFAATTDANYSSHCTFYITSIVFKNIYQKASYKQLVENPANTSSWTPIDGLADFNMFTAPESGLYQIEGTSKRGAKAGIAHSLYSFTPMPVDYYYLLPQVLNDEAVIEVKYYAVDKIGDSYFPGEELTVTKKLNEIFTDNWKQEKLYTLTITFTMDEIHWDPATEDWTADTAPSITIPTA